MKKLGSASICLCLGIVAIARVGSAQPDTSAAPATSAAGQQSASAPSTVAKTPGADAAGTNSDKDASRSAATAPSSTEVDATAAAQAPASANADEENAADQKSDKDKKKKKKKGKNKGKDKDGKDKDGKDKDGKGNDSDGVSQDNDERTFPWEVKPKIKLGGLVHTEFSINDRAPVTTTDDEGTTETEYTPNYDFRLSNARIFLTWEQGTMLDAQAEIELSRDADRNITKWAPMRDAFVRVSPDRALRMRMGQFKRPYSGLQLTSLRDLKLIRRGISDTWINEELGYGGRDVGFMLEGRIGRGLELHYSLGVFNGTGRNRREYDPNGAKDFVGRLEGHVGKYVTLAVNSANKRFDRKYSEFATYPKSTWMSGVDVLVEYAGLYGYIEGQYGTNYPNVYQHHTGSLLALVAYKFPIAQTWKLAVEPLVRGELLKAETEVRNTHILSGTAGANLYIGDIFRLMVQGEMVEPKGALPVGLGEGREEKRLIIQAGMYTR